MSDEVRIRAATAADAPNISTLLTALAEEFIVGDFPAAGREHLLSEFSTAAMADRLASAEYRFHLAESRGELLGVVALRGNSHLFALFVSRTWQRRGLARRLWNEVRQAAPADVECFTVNASRFAVPVYERLGFRSNGPMQEKSGVSYQPMVWLAPRVDPAT